MQPGADWVRRVVYVVAAVFVRCVPPRIWGVVTQILQSKLAGPLFTSSLSAGVSCFGFSPHFVANENGYEKRIASRWPLRVGARCKNDPR